MKTKTVYPKLGIIDEIDDLFEETEEDMIKYTLLNQKYGALQSFEKVIAGTEKVQIFIDNVAGFEAPFTVKLSSEETTYFARLKKGVCTFPKAVFSGKIAICIISPSGTIPCAGLIASENKDGSLTIVPDASDVLQRLENAEMEISELLNRYRDLLDKYDDLKDRITKLFSQYNF